MFPKRYSTKCLLLSALLLCCCCCSGAHAASLITKSNSTNVVATSTIGVATSAEVAHTITAAEVNATKDSDSNVNGDNNINDKVDDDDDNDDDDDDEDDDEDDDNDDSKEKTAIQPSVDTTSLSIWSRVRGIWQWLKEDFSESFFGSDDSNSERRSLTTAGRTFGKIRRLQMALIPIIFKFGILSAMVAFLVLLGMKTLFLVKLLVLMNAAVILGKFLTFKTGFGGIEHAAPTPVWGYSNWSPHVHSGWGTSPVAAQSELLPAYHPAGKEIHLHIHGAQAHPQVSTYGAGAQQYHSLDRRLDPYAAYEQTPASDFSTRKLWTSEDVMALPLARYPPNHKAF